MLSLILAGGKSQRMGRNKALIERPDGSRQLDYIISLAQALSSDILLSTNTPEIAPPGIVTLRDLHPGDGPVGALASAFASRPETTLVIGCDLFLLDHATLNTLVENHDPSATATCFANRIDGRPEPLCAIFSRQAMSQAAAAIGDGKFCARHFLESLSPTVLPLPHPVALDNANTPADLDEAFAKLSLGVAPISVKVLYFAKLREARGLDEEIVETLARTPAGLYEELRFRHRLPLKIETLRAAQNGDFCPWSSRLSPNDEIVFIPPVAGG